MMEYNHEDVLYEKMKEPLRRTTEQYFNLATLWMKDNLSKLDREAVAESYHRRFDCLCNEMWDYLSKEYSESDFNYITETIHDRLIDHRREQTEVCDVAKSAKLQVEINIMENILDRIIKMGEI